MKDPYQIIDEAEDNLEAFTKWQIDYGVSKNYRLIAESIGKAADVFTYAAILYPKFIKVEGAVVIEEHYTDENWKAARERADPHTAAALTLIRK